MNEIVPVEGELLPVRSTVQAITPFLQRIRPEWQAKSLIERVQRLLPVDASSACQRLLNAAIHDLREKVVLAGLDIAKQAAELHRLPTVSKAEDVENYSTSRLMDLAYRMGILSRAEWKKIKRCYDIRRDLEHEDDEYEAEIEDCVYIFKCCIEIVLSRDPVHLLKVTDVKDVIEQAMPQFPEEQFLEEYAQAPSPRQQEITLFLVSAALDAEKPDVVRSNAFEMMKHLESVTQNAVKIEVAKHLQEKIGRNVVDLAQMKVGHACGIAPYLKTKSRNGYFADLQQRLHNIGHDWRSHKHHAPILGQLEDIGGLGQCPSNELAEAIIVWLVLCYLGEPGGYGVGVNRSVFYSNVAAPIIKRLVAGFGPRELGILKQAASHKDVTVAMKQKKAIAQRYEQLVDMAGDV